LRHGLEQYAVEAKLGGREERRPLGVGQAGAGRSATAEDAPEQRYEEGESAGGEGEVEGVHVPSLPSMSRCYQRRIVVYVHSSRHVPGAAQR
jgi:hypothetical protein